MKRPFLVWLYPGYLDRDLDAATWLTTTTELRSLGWDVLLVAAGSPGTQVIRGTEVMCISMGNIYFLRQFIFHLGFYWLMLKQGLKPDVIMFGQMTAPWMLPLRLVRFITRRQRPLLAMDIRTVHMDDSRTQGLKGWLRGKFQGWTGKYAKYWVDGYLAITNRMADYLHLSREQLWGVWPSGVRLELFQPAQSARNWPEVNQPIRLIYIGILNYERNLMSLCQAVEQATAEGMLFELWLVGDGTERNSLEQFSKKTNGGIRVFAPVPHSEVPNMLVQAHLGVLPFHDELKFQVSSFIKLFEYMAAGLPILSTRINCITDVVEGADFAFWAENAYPDGLLEALKLVWNRRADLPDMSTLAVNIAPAWTWRASAIKLKNALERGLKENPE